MIFAIYLFACIGFLVVSWLVLGLVSELVRAIRQAGRVATAAARIDGKRRPSWSYKWYSFRQEFCRSYSALRIGPYEIPHDPSQPIRRAWLPA